MMDNAGLDALWQDWRAQLQRKPVLRLGALSILGLLWLYGVLVLDDRVSVGRLALQSQQALFDEVAGDAGDERLFDWRDRMATTLAAYRDLAVREESEGLLQASFSDDIRRVLAEHDLQVLELSVDLRPSPRDDHWPSELRLVRARVAASGSPVAMLQAWAALIEQQPGRWFDLFELNPQQNSSAQWELLALYAIDPEMSTP